MTSNRRRSTVRLTPLAACLAMTLGVGHAGASDHWPPVRIRPGHTSQADLWRLAGMPYLASAARSKPYLPLGAAPGPSPRARRAGLPDERSQVRRPSPASAFQPARPAGTTLPVTSCEDDGSAGTLRDVVAQAVSGDTVDLTALTCSVITLDAGVISTDADDLAIEGPGASALTIDGNKASLILKHTGAGALTVRGLTLANGHNTKDTGYTAPWVCDYCTYIGAGCAYSSNDLVVKDAVVTGCTVAATGDVTARGGALYARNHLTVENSTISGNTVTAEWVSMGGGIHGGREVTLTSSRVTGNALEGAEMVASYGGGVAVSCWYIDAHIEVAGSEISGNTTVEGIGGGVFVCGSANFTDTAINENFAGTGGGVGHNASDGSMRFVNSTISGNRALHLGGGVLFQGLYEHTISLANSTVTFNLSGAYLGGGGVHVLPPTDAVVSIESSIVANNGPNGYFAGDIGFYPDLSLVITGSNNLIGEVSNSVQLPADTIRDDPQLLPLADNGGFTQTHAPAPTSPAIDTGNNLAALAFDQRGDGFARVSGTAADIGAFEMQQPSDVIFRHGFEDD